MLCDYLITDKIFADSYDGLDKVFAKIKRAQKFILTKEFSIAADGFVDNDAELQKIIPYCRLPYPLMWIEWVHDDRPHWDQAGPYKARPVDPSRHQGTPLRCGFLLEQQGEPSKWKAHLFWSLKEPPQECISCYNGSLAALTIDSTIVDRALDIVSKIELADFGGGLLSVIPKDIVKRLGEYAMEDWGGEMRFMVAMLGLLNTRNVVQMEAIDKAKHNIKRVKQGKLPLFSHTLLKIRPAIYVQDPRRSLDQQHRDLRLHFVRGHFKQRKSGLFWWSMHARGSGKHGEIEKDYEL